MIKLTRTGDGEAIYISAALVSAVEPDIHADATEVCAGNFTHIVTESPADVARLVAEATRSAAGVDLEAVETARRVLIALTGNPLDLFAVLGVPAGNADAMIASVHNLAARLGAP